MSGSGVAGTRVATAIGVIKWLLIGVALVSAVVGVLNAVLSDGTGDLTVSILVIAGSAVWILFVWVLFGWFEHTLLALIAIARNTTPAVVPSYEVPPAPYEQRT
jgi:hypothetical protein